VLSFFLSHQRLFYRTRFYTSGNKSSRLLFHILSTTIIKEEEEEEKEEEEKKRHTRLSSFAGDLFVTLILSPVLGRKSVS
jgi:hypothetical protein